MDVKPMCPWCGSEMHLFCPTKAQEPPFWYNCPDEECFGSGPTAMTKEGALAAALRRTLQKPLTLQDLEALIAAGDDVAVYCEAKGDAHAYATILFAGQVISINGDKINACDLIFKNYGVTWRAWASRPTPEEQAAAAWEGSGDADL